MEKYCWRSATVNILLDYSEVLKRGTIAYFYNPIHDEAQADDKDRAEDAKKDL